MIKGRRIPDLNALKNVFYTTVRIVTSDSKGEEGVGTGFFYHFHDGDGFFPQSRIPVIVTNKHVIKDTCTGSIEFHLEKIDGDNLSGGTYALNLANFESKFILHPDPEIDLCILEVEPLFKQVQSNCGYQVRYEAFTFWQVPEDFELEDMFPISDVYMIGYPTGLWDEENNFPIARKGVTASHPYHDFNGKSQGLLDIAVFGGSSGSPIISYKLSAIQDGKSSPFDFYLLGILWGGPYIEEDGTLVKTTVPTATVKVPRTKIMINLGYYVKAKELKEFEPILLNL